MQLLFKRNKIFMLGNQRYVGSIGSDGRAPEWIKETDTYKMGLADGSIIDFKAEAARQEAEANQQETSTPEPQVPAEVILAPKVPAGLKASTQRSK
jgi:hypothetical protein